MEPATIPLLDPTIIAESKALMQEKYAKLLSYFLEDSALYIDQIESAYAAGDIEALVPPSHTLKSSSTQMGAMRLANAALLIERTARDALKTNDGLGAIASTVSQLKTMLHETIVAYQ